MFPKDVILPNTTNESKNIQNKGSVIKQFVIKQRNKDAQRSYSLQISKEGQSRWNGSMQWYELGFQFIPQKPVLPKKEENDFINRIIGNTKEPITKLVSRKNAQNHPEELVCWRTFL